MGVERVPGLVGAVLGTDPYRSPRPGSQVPWAELAQRFGAFLNDLHPGRPLDFVVVGVLSHELVQVRP